MLNKSHYFKNRSVSFTAVIIIIIIKYFKTFVYLLIITKIVLATSLIFILAGDKPVIKSIINSNIGPCGIKSTNNLLYGQCLNIYILWYILYFNI